MIAGVCYFSPKPKVTWSEAAALCEGEAARLATPGVGQLSERGKLPGGEDILWAAVRQAENADTPTAGWTWGAGAANALPFDALNWSANEPNDGGNADEDNREDCGAVIRSRAMKYDDKSCASKYVVLCQRIWN